MTFPIALSITTQYLITLDTVVSGLIMDVGGGLMVVTWFVMLSWPWRHQDIVLYLCTRVTGVYAPV